MRIDSIRLFRVPLAPDVSGERHERFESVLVAMTSGAQTGWGEATLGAAPCESAEWSAGAFACLREWLAPALVGQTISSGQELQQALAPFQGNRRAKSALDIAWWNLNSTNQSKPLFQSLGGQTDTVPLSVSLGVMESTETFISEIGKALGRGYDHVTLKFRPGWGLEMLRAVRQTFTSEAIAVDCDGLGSLAQQDTYYRLEDFFLKYIEQPLPADDLVAHAMLQQAIRTPICLDQSIESPARVEQALDLDSCGLARVDVGRVGGLTPALAIGATLSEARIPCAVGAVSQGPLAALAAMSLATVAAFSSPAELSILESPSWVVGDTHEPRVQSGRLVFQLPDGTASGITIDPKKVSDVALDHATIG
jgi:O-succinylbenzoate synthase